MRWLRLAVCVLLAFSVVAASSVFPPTRAEGKAAQVRVRAFKLLNEGVAAYKRGEYALAAEKLQESASMALNSFRAHYYLGLALIGDRRYSEALEALFVALDLNPTHLIALVAQGDAHLKLGDLEEARASYFRALQLRPEFAPSLDGLARIYDAQADAEQAVAHFRRAIASDLGYAPAYTHLGDFFLREDRFDEAVELLEEAISVRPDFAAGLNRLALAYGRLGLRNLAVATIRKAMELEPGQASHPATLGLLHLDDGQLEIAEGWFQRALELDPQVTDARIGLAEVARIRGEYDGALSQIATAASDPRLDAAIRKRLAEIDRTLRREKTRFAELQAILASGGATPADYAELARIFASRREWDRALQLQRSAGAEPESAERLAYMLFQADRFREAHKLYSELAERTGRADLRINDGVSMARLGDDAAAVEAFRDALTVDPQSRMAHLYMGNSLLRLGRREQAIDAYAEFLARGRKGEAAERVRRILQQIAPQSLPEPEAVVEPQAAEAAPGAAG